jgi:hypothetical protein
LLLVIWSFFSFSTIKFFSIFLFTIKYSFFWYACLSAFLFFFYYFIFKFRFIVRLNYLQYGVSNILFTGLVTIFSYAYYKVIMLDNDDFVGNFFIAILISNFSLGSLLYLFTLIKRQ